MRLSYAAFSMGWQKHEAKRDCPVGIVWNRGPGYHVAVIDIRPESPGITQTSREIIPTRELGERPVWLTRWLALDWQCIGLTFATVPADKSPLAVVTDLWEAV